MALQEDLYAGDPSTDALFGDNDMTSGIFLAKAPLSLAGLDVVTEVFAQVDPRMVASWSVDDGARVDAGTVIGTVSGPVRGLLRGERVALNFLRHLSGIATLTRACADVLEGSKTRLVDTRKTTPGMRELEKAAVRAGGGYNHRYNLSSGVMLKDNHIAAAGSIASAVERVRAYAPFTLRIEVEVETMGGVQEALDAGVDIIMLDNMATATMREAIALIDGRAIVEASGNITIDRLAELRDIGLDIISSGAITHSAPQVDISVKINT
jgi:nicotinate-nucleotide pyrophosphorylase (carboxylating)